MSRSSVQSLTILAVVTGSIQSIIDANIAGDAAPTILYLKDRAQEVVNKWPESGDPQKNMKRITRHIHNIKDQLDSAVDIYSACCLGMLAQELLVLMFERLRDEKKLALIRELLESVNNAIDIYDPKEIDSATDSETRKEAERLCQVIQTEIGW